MSDIFINKKITTKAESRSIPVFFSNTILGRVYERFNGSSFVIYFKNQYYLITADHVLRDSEGNRIPDENIRFNDINYKGQPFHIYSIISPVENKDEIDDAYKDFNVYPIDIEKLSSEHITLIKEYAYKDIELTNLILDEELLIVGFPTQLKDSMPILNWTDFDENHHHITVLSLPCKYKGASEMDHISKVQFTDEYKTGGISGSPVYAKRQNKLVLVGMLVRGSSNTGSIYTHFMNINVLYSAMDK
ncbi:hypothetical protein EHQ82_05455 [Leptospira selangorensis]|uniref:Serine protease n=1 Tax=Leptospira selangorensis TaxID=2484982 RepID=A0ABY2NFK8_9LEPT|nr:hypothetical protein [Leptospira selangorensis]TGM23575.1 hypothetical protein EHQ82_05455 [Leptospira selangorensis]